jgi:flagellar basal body rod protein FlgG
MNYGLYLSASGLRAQQDRYLVTANNLANANTTGFKRDLTVMRARLNAVHEDPKMFPYRMPVTQDQGGGLFAVSGGIDLSQGELQTTDNPTDLALEGHGFFTVQGNNGQKLLTRDGKFVRDQNGSLVRATDSKPVLDNNGQPIKLNPDLPIAIDGRGRILQGNQVTAQLGLTDVSNPGRLRKTGDNLLTVDDPAALKDLPQDSQVLQGKTEASGVNSIMEMVNLMEGQRAFEANARMITFQDSTMSQLNTVGRVA